MVIVQSIVLNMHDVQELKQTICEIGDRIYKRGFAAANDGNITMRLNDAEVLCTPTMCCKGFLTPDDICVVNMEGEQLGGCKKRSSETPSRWACAVAAACPRAVPALSPGNAETNLMPSFSRSDSPLRIRS